MRDRSKKLLVINTGKKESGQTRLPAQSGTTHIIGGGGLSVNMSDYLLKSIWDKVFEIRTDSQGTEYIFGKLPVVTQYGITMYSGDGVDIPSLASGLPFDGRTIWYNPDTNQIEVIGGTGGGSGEGVSNFWDLSGIPSWITNSKPKYTYSEIEGTPDLSGFATQNWIISQGYASAEELKKYIPISGYTEVSGEKNFTGGLKVNGSPIYYDTEKKYWKLEGDLLVTGGVTMYGSDSSFTPSTIMDAILYDDTTLGINSNGQLYVKGGAGGGINTTDLQNYLTQNSYLNITSGDNRYLKLSGGTLDGVLTLRASNSSSDSWIEFSNKSNSVVHKLGVRRPESIYGLHYYNGSEYYKIWHEGNDGSGSGLDADLLDGQEETTFAKWKSGIASSDEYRHIGYAYGSGGWKTSGAAMSFGADKSYFMQIQGGGNTAKEVFLYARYIYNGIYSDWKTIAFTDSNVASATKLENNDSYTAWGQTFFINGKPNNIYGTAYFPNGDLIYAKDEGGANQYILGFTSSLGLGYGSAGAGYDTYILGNNIHFRYSTSRITGFTLNSSGNVGIGTTSPNQKLHVEGGVRVNGQIIGATSIVSNTTNGFFVGNRNDGLGVTDGGLLLYTYGKTPISFYASGERMRIDASSGNVGIGTTNPQDKLDVAGNIKTNGGLLFTRVGTGTYNKFTISSNTTYGVEIEAPRATDSSTGTALPIFIGWRGGALGIKITSGGNLLVNGAITMYSDQRKKTILNHVELSLKQIADAPLIEHYYNSDEKKTTHVGSIAQYWASMNDWFCKLDSEGYYTMEIQNAALASAISVARELVKFENETDKRIRLLEEENKELRNEIERLKAS